MIRKLHHNAYRCRDSEQTRAFYEDFPGLPLAGTLEIKETKSGRPTNTLHTFYRLDDGSFLAFFEAPDASLRVQAQHDYDLHIALVGRPALEAMLARAGAGHRDARRLQPRLHRLDLLPRPQRLRDRAVRRARTDRAMDPASNGAREAAALDRTQRRRLRVTRDPDPQRPPPSGTREPAG